VFDHDPYESRRASLKGSRLLKVLVIFQLIKSTKLRGLLRTIEDQPSLQAELGGTVARNSLSNALQQRELEQMIEAWLLVLQTYQPWLARLGKKFARLAVVDASLIKLSLAAYDWAAYRSKSGAAKMTAVYEWACAIPSQFVFSTGKVHDLKAAAALKWMEHWTYVFDRGYFCFRFLAQVRSAGAHFVVRFKQGVSYRILARRPVAVAPASTGLTLRSDWSVSLPGWPEVVLRLVSYQLPDGKLIRILTDRFDLTALSVAQLYKERWTIENWWRWLKRLYKIKEPLGTSQKALPLQIVGAFVTDLLLRAFKQSSGFTSNTYEFVVRCQEASLTPIAQLTLGSALRRALEAIFKLFSSNSMYLELVA
jgi:hypothetical protein